MNENKAQVLCGIGEKKSNNGTQYYQQDRIYDDSVAIAVTTSFNPYYIEKPRGGGKNLMDNEERVVGCAIRGRENGQQLEISDREQANAITTVQKDSLAANQLRIRKLTPRECFRLMGLKDKDIDLIMENQTNSSAYHLAGDSIVTTCLMAIFGELLGIDWKEQFDPKKWWVE